jgi:hypothetical protein
VGATPALSQGLRCQHTAFDLIGSRQRNRARKACGCQRALGVDSGLGSVEVYRIPVRFDDHGTTVLQLHSPDGVDATGAEAHVGDCTAQPVPGPRVQEAAQLEQCHRTVDRPLSVADFLQRLILAASVHDKSMGLPAACV